MERLKRALEYLEMIHKQIKKFKKRSGAVPGAKEELPRDCKDTAQGGFRCYTKRDSERQMLKKLRAII